ncbi:DUF2059 domain-containing protein [Novosphingobium sp. ZN18A2]|uniref:DUF2059 domain-containing protein n=1 Tax=Novosphingobium sp. ZN18A2 TaxID=3079861 RepID=UPI0030CF789A
MKVRTILAMGAATFMLAAQPTFAAPQTARSSADEQMAVAAMADMFKAEPLTAEQQARLPKAERIVGTIMPPGTMQSLMGSMFSRILDPMMKKFAKPGAMEIARQLGRSPGTLDLSPEAAGEIEAILDPAWQQRNALQMSVFKESMGKAMSAMEPDMRVGMAQAYAVNFTDAQLDDILAFFTTPTGLVYARRSYMLASDPHILAASMKGLPKMLDNMKTMQAKVSAATSGLPPRRGYDDLSADQRETLARLTGLTQDQIQRGMERAAGKQADAGK